MLRAPGAVVFRINAISAARRGGRVNREVSAGVFRKNAIYVLTRRLPVVVMLRAPVP